MRLSNLSNNSWHVETHHTSLRFDFSIANVCRQYMMRLKWSPPVGKIVPSFTVVTHLFRQPITLRLAPIMTWLFQDVKKLQYLNPLDFTGTGSVIVTANDCDSKFIVQ